MKKNSGTVEVTVSRHASDHDWHSLIRRERLNVALEILPVIFHKLKNKLTPILGYSQLLMSQIQDDKNRERLRKIEFGAEELAELMNQLKDFFEIDDNLLETGSLNAVVNGLSPYFSLLEKDYDLKITLDLEDNIPSIPFNKAQVKVLICELLSNSIRAVKLNEKKTGAVKIQTGLFNDGCSIMIEDNGIGIQEDEMVDVFAPFYSSCQGHAGLGLTICERIAHNHDAKIMMTSKPGEITSFTVIFPATNAESHDLDNRAKSLKED